MGLKWTYDLGSFIVFFFVLSSYLITRILLEAKEKSLERNIPVVKAGLNFLTRRTLRIFPAYYVYLIILMFFVIEGMDVREHPFYYFAYLYNVRIFLTGNWGPYVVHLWTLGVEEQFYLIWPWIILFVPTRFLPKLFGLLVLAGITFRMLILTINPQTAQFPMLTLTPACIDAFAAGALLAFLHYSGKEFNPWLKWVLLGALPIWLWLIIGGSHHRVFIGLDRVYISLMSVVIIDKANRGYTGIVKLFLENRLVQYLSKISYGIYLYHLISPLLFWNFFGFVQRLMNERGYDLSGLGTQLSSPYISFWIYFLLSIGLAMMSWYFIEQPFNKLKKLFEYVVPKKKTDSQVRV